MLRDIIYRNLSGRIPIVSFIPLGYFGSLHMLLPPQAKEDGLPVDNNKRLKYFK